MNKSCSPVDGQR